MTVFIRAATAAVVPASGAAAAPAAPALKLEGAPNGKTSIAAADLAQLPRLKVAAIDHDGTQASFEGWPLGEVLAASVVAKAADGYRVVLALAELEPTITDKVVLLADRRDGKPLPASEGPWRLVIPSDKRPARWIRQIVSFTIVRPEEAK